jgi:hypothetical protein
MMYVATPRVAREVKFSIDLLFLPVFVRCSAKEWKVEWIGQDGRISTTLCRFPVVLRTDFFVHFVLL